MNALLLAASIFLALLGYGILRNEFCKNLQENHADLYSFNIVSSLLSAVTLVIITMCTGSLGVPSLYTVLMGALYGLATALCAVLSMAALENGPLSYSNLIISCAMVIPALSGLVLYGEEVTAWQYVGIALMLASFACAVDKNDKGSGMTLKWLVLCLGAFVCSGAVGVMQKLHQKSSHAGELGVFLVIAFVFYVAFSVAMTLYYTSVKGEKITVTHPKKLKKSLVLAIVSGVGIALVNQINLHLSGVMDAIILYPVNNGASMILTAAAGIILWKEKLNRRQWVGLILGGIAILLLCNIL